MYYHSLIKKNPKTEITLALVGLVHYFIGYLKNKFEAYLTKYYNHIPEILSFGIKTGAVYIIFYTNTLHLKTVWVQSTNGFIRREFYT